MKKTLPILAVILGFVFIALAGYYWLTPAGALPTYFPGFESGVTTVHFKHGLASGILGVALFIYAWFSTGPRHS